MTLCFNEDKANQVNTLIYTMGDSADDLLGFMDLSKEEIGKYDIVESKFKAHFVKSINLI